MKKLLFRLENTIYEEMEKAIAELEKREGAKISITKYITRAIHEKMGSDLKSLEK